MDNASNEPDKCQDFVGKTEERSDLEVAYKDQGYHEMEFTSGLESELHERKKQCQKNPTHAEFIPANEFTIEQLPECYRDGPAFDFVATMIVLTVRLAVSYTSLDRPPNYPLYNRRGKLGLTAFGSGWVSYVCRRFKEKYGDTCPCETCKQSPHQAKEQWGVFWVMTAKHVVFDSSEARHTKCHLFFDRDEDCNDCPSLEVVEVVDSDLETDKCYMKCITHDEDVCKRLEEMVDRYRELTPGLTDRYKKSEHVCKYRTTAVVISHPHGLSKHVTVGEGTGRQTDYPYKCTYSAETCAGSSGAPVCTLGKWSEIGRLELIDTTHSGSKQKGENQSTG